MSKRKKNSIESLFYNNKFLMIFSVIVAILLWTTVKINYSDELTRTIQNYTIDLENTISKDKDIVAFYDGELPKVEVEVKGKAYNINEQTLEKEDIVVEASTDSYVDSAGYKLLTITARITDPAITGVTINKVTPSTVRVYFDRRRSPTLDVKVKLNNEIDELVADGYVVGQPVPSMDTVGITGPYSAVEGLKEVVFEVAEIDKEKLPLTESITLDATVTYPNVRADLAKFIVCNNLSDGTNTATVTIPVSISKEVDTSVSFLKKPAIYDEEKLQYNVYPSKVTVQYKSAIDISDPLSVGTIDFSEMSNTVNRKDIPVNEDLAGILADKSIEKFTVTVDMSDKARKALDMTRVEPIFIGNDDNYTYTVDYEKSELDSIAVIGPKDKLEKITEENVQVNVDVSSLDLMKRGNQMVEASISITSEESAQCWVYGKYKVYISVEPKD